MSDCCSKKQKNIVKEVDLDSLEGTICYCFQKTKNELFEAVKKKEENLFIEDVKSKMKDPGCFCATANPAGKCCLADIFALMEAIKKSNPLVK